ncbi:AHH domain-containing protein [Paenactinomyces guangxiensis]|uniref:AHH domain-containing protein n=2 Tax=Paenactinomyces guangxiensis TaxID=1490290 RepID=A0A7W1WQ70_9BACL|nr:AHH domain-containing protein [Paenactinomyces guangxiensis]MBH8591245.1 AHH domain-containing protein [Paenactinomyces guangxiensis]
MSFGISFALNGWKIDETTWLDAAFGGVLGLFGLGFAGGAARVLATGLGRKLVTGLANARVLGPLLKSGGKLISKLPQPLQKIFSKAGFIGSVEGAGTSIVDDLLRGREINWKNALISGFGGALLVGMGSFIAPKIDPFVDKVTTAVKEYTRPVVAKVSPVVQKLDDFDIKKCFSYQKPPGYSASIFLPSFDLKDCIYSADGGGGGGSSKTNSSDGAKVTSAQGYSTLVSNRTKVVGDYEEGTQASVILRKELKLAGVEPPPYPNAAHHIIPWNDSRAREAQQLLREFGIDHDSAVNGVFLPYVDSNHANGKYVGNESLHQGNHSRKYIAYVTSRLREVKEAGGTTADAVRVLNDIRSKLLDGSLPLN